PDSLLLSFAFFNNSIELLRAEILFSMLCFQFDGSLGLSEASWQHHCTVWRILATSHMVLGGLVTMYSPAFWFREKSSSLSTFASGTFRVLWNPVFKIL
ncbi:hypothetical protein TCON_1942, partial [Astathelohania contejeani]